MTHQLEPRQNKESSSLDSLPLFPLLHEKRVPRSVVCHVF